MASPAKRPSSTTKFSETGHPVYIGVRRKAITCDRWVCEVRKANKKKRILVGTFDTAEMAARAHDVAAMALRDQSACLNFPDSKWLLHPPSTLSSLKDIKHAANEAAELFRPRDHIQIDDMEGARSSTSSSESVEEKEVMSASSEKYDAFDLDKNGEMNPWSYYACLAEGLLMDPPVRNYEDLDEGESLIELLLWS